MRIILRNLFLALVTSYGLVTMAFGQTCYVYYGPFQSPVLKNTTSSDYVCLNFEYHYSAEIQAPVGLGFTWSVSSNGHIVGSPYSGPEVTVVWDSDIGYGQVSFTAQGTEYVPDNTGGDCNQIANVYSYEGSYSIAGVFTTPVISPPSPSTICLGSSTTFSVSPQGTGYQWKLNGSDIVGATNATYQATLAGTYTVVVSQDVCSLLSNQNVASIPSLPPVPTVTQSVRQVIPGQSLLTASGASNFQWKKDDADIPGETSSTYSTLMPGIYKVGTVVSGCPQVSLGVQVVGNNNNFTVSNNVLKPNVVTEADFLALVHTDAKFLQSVQYQNLLGKPWQSVNTQASPITPLSGVRKDIVLPVVYDNLGRVTTNYLPFVSTQNNGLINDPSTVLAIQQTFYTNSADKIANDNSPYSKTEFEASPLGRPVAVGSEGAAWQTVTGAFKTVAYGTAANDIRYFTISNGLPVSTSTWSNPTNGFLWVTTETNEQGIQVQNIRNQEGLTIVDRTKIDATNWAETYYVYDEVNNLRFVLSPELIKILRQAANFNPTQAQLDAWTYQKNYDSEGRVVEEKGPGSDWVYRIYDTRGRLVLSQNGRQRLVNEWMYSKYDELNRVVISGIYTHSAPVTRTAMQAIIDALNSGLGYENLSSQSSVGPSQSSVIEVSSYSGTNEYLASQSVTLKPGFTFTAGVSAANFHAAIVDDSGYSGSGDVFPTTSDEALVLTYYDDYLTCSVCQLPGFGFVSESWKTNPTLINEPFQSFVRQLGGKIATSTKVLGTETWLNAVSYFNRNGNIIQVIGSNHLGGIDRISTLVDFSGKALEVLRTATGYNSGGIATIRIRNDYDDGGRVLRTRHQINNQNEVILAALEYDELSGVVAKRFHSYDDINYLQKADYRYNIRGWLTNINNIPTGGNDANDYFSLDLFYNNLNSGNNTARLDGMITSTLFNHDLGSKRRLYNFQYDNLGRLQSASHKMSTNGGNTWTGEPDYFNESGITYDLNGNIKTLNRNTEYFNGNVYESQQIDQLEYDYTSFGGNQLGKVTDLSTKPEGFKDGNNPGNDYMYDPNGNVTQDLNKGIVSITYYFNNLPNRVTFTDGTYLQHTYDAMGIKLKRTFYNNLNQIQSTIDYVGELVLLDGQVLNISHGEGRITAPTYSNLIPNREAGSLTGFAGQQATLSALEINSQTYVKAVATMNHTAGDLLYTNGIRQIGNIYAVKPGETYSFKVLGYSVSGNARVFVTMDYMAANIWQGSLLPTGAANEDWVTQTFTVPAGMTFMIVGVRWDGAVTGDSFLVNKVALYKVDFEYNYFLRDQVGSPRVVLQSTPATLTYTATMETQNQVDESAIFNGINLLNLVASPGNVTLGGTKAIRLDVNNRIGPGKSIKVYPGDLVTASVTSYFPTSGGFTKATGIVMGAAVATSFGGVVSAPGDPGSIYSNVYGAYNGGLAGLSPDQGSTNPSAFLNYILFDRTFKPISGQSFPISPTANSPQLLNMSSVSVAEIGYLYIYLSYDNATGGEVFFDEFKITHQESPVIQVNSYYPFGMVSYSWLREGEISNAYLFQGKELISQTGWHDFGSRMYWADLGRWFSTDPQKQFSSPYVGMGNMPVVMVDPDGELAWFVPMIVGALVGGTAQGAAVAANGGKFFDGFWRGFVTGAVGGALAPIGGGSFLSNMIWGAGEGAITGGVNAALWGTDIGEGMLNGAAWGAAFAGVTSTIEGVKNAKEGYGFGTNDGVSNRLVDEAVTDYVGTVDPAKAQRAIDFIQKRYGMDEVKMTYDPNLKSYGGTKLGSGDVLIGPKAFENNSASMTKATQVHELAHSLKDRMALLHGRYRWGPSLELSKADWNYMDGTTGYSNEIFNSGKLHINKTTLSKINAEKLVVNPVWHRTAYQSGFIASKWWYQIPRRFAKVNVRLP